MFMKNKVVVIVGGSKGIGKGLYDSFIDKDCIVHSISRKNCDITNPDQIIIDEHFNVNVPYACVTDNSYTYNKLKYDCSINSGITEFKKELEKVKLNKYKLLDNSYYGY